MDNQCRESCSNSASVRGRINSSAVNACSELKKRFQQVEFALTETVLYLDAYPECREALDYYHMLLEERNMLLEEINEQCCPMTMYGNTSTDNWNWVNGPWPWQYEAN